MDDLRIDRLVVRSPGLAAEEGRRLGLQIASALAAAGGLPAAGDIPRIEVRVSMQAHADVSDLARLIADDAARQLRRGAS